MKGFMIAAKAGNWYWYVTVTTAPVCQAAITAFRAVVWAAESETAMSFVVAAPETLSAVSTNLSSNFVMW